MWWPEVAGIWETTTGRGIPGDRVLSRGRHALDGVTVIFVAFSQIDAFVPCAAQEM
jgi:hypothetical protein